jgi:dolichyl-diphosphooligosaccharide--protein glycosyltransferase
MSVEMNGRPSLKLSKLQICSDATIFVTASTGGSDGRALIFDDFRESYSWLKHNTPEVMRDNIHLSAAESFSHRVSCKKLEVAAILNFVNF